MFALASLRSSGSVSLIAMACLLAACTSNGEEAQASDESDVTSASCTPGGLYCGGDGIKGDSTTLYRCDGASVTQVQKCPAACTVNPPGKKDACAATHSAAEATAFVKAFYGKDGPSLDPQAQAAQRASLTPELARHVEHQPFVPGNGANFVCAQDLPEAVSIGATTLDGADALVTVNETFGEDVVKAIVRVRLSDLKIAGWTCGKPVFTTVDAHRAVKDFYGAHGPYAEDGLGLRSPAGLSTDLRQKLDSLPYAPGEGDLLTCAQMRPESISVDPPVEMGDFAVTVVREKYGRDVTEVVAAVGLPDLAIHTTMCAPFEDGGVWSR